MTALLERQLNRRSLLQTGAAAAFVTGVTAYSASDVWAAVAHGSSLDPGDMQVLFADLQVALVSGSGTTPPSVVSRAAGSLAQVASVLKMPMLFSVVPEGQNPPVLLPELRSYATEDNTLLRTPVSPFNHAPTVAALAKSGRKTLVIAGYATEVVVEQTALDAIEAGYTVFHVVDAMGSLSQRGEEAAMRAIEQAGSTPTSVLSLSTRLVNDFVTSPGPDVLKAILPLLQN
jgi:hypothetical protein